MLFSDELLRSQLHFFLIKETNWIKIHRYCAVEAELVCKNNKFGNRFSENQNNLGKVKVSAKISGY